MHFYSMSDEQVLKMPARRFWTLERQINRIRAESDLRQISTMSANNSADNHTQVRDRLVLELGDTAQFKRNLIVKRDPDAKAKFARVMG